MNKNAFVFKPIPVVVAILAFSLIVQSAPLPPTSNNCTTTSKGYFPLNDLGGSKYLGQFLGGLYAPSRNTMPLAHATAGLTFGQTVQPLNKDTGLPDPLGKYVLLSIGMSNTSEEFYGTHRDIVATSWSFMGKAEMDPGVNHTTLAIVNGAQATTPASKWVNPEDSAWNVVRDERLAPFGLSEEQVQVIWLKVVNSTPTVSLPNSAADAYNLEANLGKILRNAKSRYRNLQQVFLSSRIYGGYAKTGLSPEPYAYESGFSVKWLIAAQINQMRSGGTSVDPLAGDLNYNTGVAPWIAWGPYTWADGVGSDDAVGGVPGNLGTGITYHPVGGLEWLCEDFEKDGTHPDGSAMNEGAEGKVGQMLLDFFKSDPRTSMWFLQ